MLNRNDEREGFGNVAVVTNASSLVAISTFSIVGDVVEWFNTDSVKTAMAILTFTPSQAPTAGDSIKLYASKNLVDGVKSESFPSTANKNNLLAEFIVEPLLAEQTIIAEINLSNCKTSQGYLFAIESLLTTALINVNDGWTLTIVPKTIGTD